MLDWLWNNKEWIFAGIGVSALSIIVALIRKFTARPTPQAAGGEGGNAAIIMGKGEAYGGAGGRGGGQLGPGGRGGSGRIIGGDGKVTGGAGGNSK